MFNEATFREILIPASGNINDYVTHISRKYADLDGFLLIKEDVRIKQLLKENGYQETILSKIFNRITNNHNLFQPQQQRKATNIEVEEIEISVYLPYIEGTSEKLRHIL